MLTHEATLRPRPLRRLMALGPVVLALGVLDGGAPALAAAPAEEQPYQHAETRRLVGLVNEAAKRIESRIPWLNITATHPAHPRHDVSGSHRVISQASTSQVRTFWMA